MRARLTLLGACLLLSLRVAQATPACLSSHAPPCPSFEPDTPGLTIVDLVHAATLNERPFARQATPLLPAFGSRRPAADEDDSARLFGEIFLPAGGLGAAFRKRLQGAPEPATFTLIGSALLGIGIARRRRQA